MEYHKKKRTRSERNRLRQSGDVTCKERLRSLPDISLQHRWPEKPAIITSSRLTMRLGLFNQSKLSKKVTRDNVSAAATVTATSNNDSDVNVVQYKSNLAETITDAPSASQSARQTVECDKDVIESSSPQRTLSDSPDMTQISSYLTSVIDLKSWYPTAPDYLDTVRRRLLAVHNKSSVSQPVMTSSSAESYVLCGGILSVTARRHSRDTPSDRSRSRDRDTVTEAGTRDNKMTSLCDDKENRQQSSHNDSYVCKPLGGYRNCVEMFGNKRHSSTVDTMTINSQACELEHRDNDVQRNAVNSSSVNEMTASRTTKRKLTNDCVVDMKQSSDSSSLFTDPNYCFLPSWDPHGDPQAPLIPTDALIDARLLLEYNELQYKKRHNAEMTSEKTRLHETVPHSAYTDLSQQDLVRAGGYREDLVRDEVFRQEPVRYGFCQQDRVARDGFCLQGLVQDGFYEQDLVQDNGGYDAMINQTSTSQEMMSHSQQQCYRHRDRDVLDSIDSNQTLDDLLTFTARDTNSNKTMSQARVQCSLVSATDSDGSPVWDIRLPMPSFLTRPRVLDSPSPELKYYKRKAF